MWFILYCSTLRPIYWSISPDRLEGSSFNLGTKVHLDSRRKYRDVFFFRGQRSLRRFLDITQKWLSWLRPIFETNRREIGCLQRSKVKFAVSSQSHLSGDYFDESGSSVRLDCGGGGVQSRGHSSVRLLLYLIVMNKYRTIHAGANISQWPRYVIYDYGVIYTVTC